MVFVFGVIPLATLVGTLPISVFYVWATRLGKLDRAIVAETHDKPGTTT